jgi:hypothetical protein
MNSVEVTGVEGSSNVTIEIPKNTTKKFIINIEMPTLEAKWPLGLPDAGKMKISYKKR